MLADDVLEGKSELNIKGYFSLAALAVAIKVILMNSANYNNVSKRCPTWTTKT